MKKCVLIDSSVWIAVTRKGGDPVLTAEVGELLFSRMAAMTEPVWIELYQGIKGKQEEAKLKKLKETCTWLAFDEGCWTEAAITARACQRSDVNVPLGDVLVHACAARYGVELKERDRHFAMIRKAIKR